MARKAKELSPLSVSRLTKPGHHAVGGVAGLYLYVIESGARSWVLRAMVGGRRRHIGLGGFPDVPLAQAKERARKARDEIAEGVDPVVRKQAIASALRASQAAEITFKAAAEAYVEAHGDTWRNAKHRAQWTSTLSSYAYPIVGSLLVQDVGQEHILKILQPIWKTKTETASRLRGRLEIDLRKREGASARALEFAILTAVRSGEARGATWGEIDKEAKVWTIPASRMKAGKEHRVPLSAAALRIIDAMSKIEKSDFIFAAPQGGMLSDMALTQVMRRMKVDAVPHGFRSTFRDWAGERTHRPREVAEQALAHTLESKVEAAYRRGDSLEKRRALMNDWERFVETPPDSRLPSTLFLPKSHTHTKR